MDIINCDFGKIYIKFEAFINKIIFINFTYGYK
jgi:hypothetical protein